MYKNREVIFIGNSDEDVPLIKFEGDASAPILRYDVPSPSSYTGKVFIETDIGKEYFGGNKIFGFDPKANKAKQKEQQNELFSMIKNRFLRENRDAVRNYLAIVSLKELEEQLDHYSLKEEEIDISILEKAKLDALARAAKSAKAGAESARNIANGKEALAKKLRAIADQYQRKVQATKARLKKEIAVPVSILNVFLKPMVVELWKKNLQNAEKAAKVPIAKAEAATTEASNALALAIKLEQGVKDVDERLTEEKTKDVNIMDLIDIEGMGSNQAKYVLFKYLMDIAWQVDQKFPIFSKTMGGSFKMKFAKVREICPRLIFIETHKLTNFPGDYGAGTTIKTFSLLPGEQTEISVKTFKKSKEDMKKASSILDSYTEEKADEFEKGIQNENARSSKEENSSSFSIKAEAGVSFGCGSASVEAGYEGSASSAREDSCKNVMNATQKHAQKASAKRDVNVNTSFERSEEIGEETSIMRKIENMNSSRTLNFTFRQMNQQFHSILHICDLRIGFYNGYPGSMRVYALPELGHFVKKYMQIEGKPWEEIYKDIKAQILEEYTKVMDYQSKPQALIEEVKNGINIGYLRVIPPIEVKAKKLGQQEYVMRKEKKDAEGNIIQPIDIRPLEGVILSRTVITMRTDGVIAESLLGKANALDDYALDARKEKIREKKYENKKIKLAISLINALKAKEGGEEEAVKAYQKIFGIKEGIEIAKDLLSRKNLEASF